MSAARRLDDRRGRRATLEKTGDEGRRCGRVAEKPSVTMALVPVDRTRGVWVTAPLGARWFFRTTWPSRRRAGLLVAAAGTGLRRRLMHITLPRVRGKAVSLGLSPGDDTNRAITSTVLPPADASTTIARRGTPTRTASTRSTPNTPGRATHLHAGPGSTRPDPSDDRTSCSPGSGSLSRDAPHTQGIQNDTTSNKGHGRISPTRRRPHRTTRARHAGAALRFFITSAKMRGVQSEVQSRPGRPMRPWSSPSPDSHFDDPIRAENAGREIRGVLSTDHGVAA
jgi:hypothetical protein